MPAWFESALIRALRTFLQTFLSAYVGGLLDVLGVGGPGVVGVVLAAVGSWSFAEQALAAALVATLTFAQNLIEGITPLAYKRG